MNLRRTIVAILLSLIMAFLPTVATAVARACVEHDMLSSLGTPSDSSAATAIKRCPCDKAMPGCGGLTQCQAGPGCASHCQGFAGVLSGSERPAGLVRTRFGFTGHVRLASLSLAPPAPPPRA